jgi:transcriptional regulator with XRE-family HTH domain
MNPIEALHEHIRHNHPRAITSLTPPLRRDGIWSLDVDLEDKKLAIEWNRRAGFGVTSVSPDNFGEGPDEVIGSIEGAQQRVDQLLTTMEHTSPPFAILLSRLRERRGLTQQELALKMGVRQASISGLEHRDDLQLSTVRRVIEGLGGKLEVFALFADARYRIEVSASECRPRLTVYGTAEHQPDNHPGVAQEYDFEGLREAGTLGQALAEANAISTRRSIYEFI